MSDEVDNYEKEESLSGPDSYESREKVADKQRLDDVFSSASDTADYPYSGEAKILEEHPVSKEKENVIAGLVGAFLFVLLGGVLWFIIYQFGFLSAISGLVTVVCANFGYRTFAKTISLKGVIISSIIAVLVIGIAWYMALSYDVFKAFKQWYDAGEVAYTVTFPEAVRGAYVFLQEPEIAGSYFKDLAIGVILCIVGAFSFVKNAVRAAKK